MGKFYIVEDCNSCEFYGFRTVDGVRKFLLDKFIDNMEKWYAIDGQTSAQAVEAMGKDLVNIMTENYPYIEDAYYTHIVEVKD